MLYKVIYASNQNEKCVSFLRTIHDAIREAEYKSMICHSAYIINTSAGNSFVCAFEDGIEKK